MYKQLPSVYIKFTQHNFFLNSHPPSHALFLLPLKFTSMLWRDNHSESKEHTHTLHYKEIQSFMINGSALILLISDWSKDIFETMKTLQNVNENLLCLPILFSSDLHSQVTWIQQLVGSYEHNCMYEVVLWWWQKKRWRKTHTSKYTIGGKK